MNIFNYTFDWKNVNLFTVLNGCSQAVLNIIKDSEDPTSTQDIANYRLAICRACPLGQVDGVTCFKSSNYTVPHVQTGTPTEGCSCVLACKTPLKDQACPAGKWGAIYD